MKKGGPWPSEAAVLPPDPGESFRHRPSSLFAAIASGDEVQRGKPAPDIFLLAARKLGASPKDCYVFEDSPNGILAAYAAGMKPVMVPDLMPATEDIRQKCFALFHSLTEARPFFMKRL